MKWVCRALPLLLACSFAFSKNHLVQLKAVNAEVVAEYLEQNGFDIPGHLEATGKVDVVTEAPEKLKELSKRFTNDPRLHFVVRSVTETASYRKLSGTGIADFIESYYDPEESLSVLKGLEQKYGKWAKVYNLNEWLGLGKTEEGRALYALQISTRPGVFEDEPKVLVIGQHHARELMTHHIVLDSAKDLLEKAASGDSRTLKYIENSSVWFVPVVNPDGLAYVFDSDRMWRKNRKRNSDGTRGVDLNRNYAFKWGACGTNSSSGFSPVFKGPAAQSEIEVQVMDLLNKKLQAQYVLSYHSYGNEVLFPYVCGSVAEEKLYYQIRDNLAAELGYRMRVASSSGEDFEHHYAKYGSISFLVEVGSSFQPNFSDYKENIWPTIKKSVPFILNELHESYVDLKVVDAESGTPLQAKLAISELSFSEGESRATDVFGSYRWKLIPGSYNLKVSLQGYEDKSVVVVATGRIDKLRIALKRKP